MSTNKEPNAAPVTAAGSDWTDEQCAQFMSVALRNVELGPRQAGPSIYDIRLGARLAMTGSLASAPPQPAQAEVPQPCGCRIGTCESKSDRRCRMVDEIAEERRRTAQPSPPAQGDGDMVNSFLALVRNENSAYIDAFYEIADALGIGGARSISPKEFFENFMLPRIKLLRATHTIAENAGLIGIMADEGKQS